ncbi:MAG: PhzF family phenazine biosynthesis protein [Chloroflexota bacterium]|nr:PhzF family phenazine biosynthesis protein [Chloroflexota bacterium]
MEHWAFVICDVFTDRPLAGNQLAVFTDARPIPEGLLQPLAREINFSETVFVYPPEADGDARIRIFIPTAEIPFAGHPVLGTAFVLASGNDKPGIRLETGAGTIPVRIERDGGRPSFGWMTQLIPQIVSVQGADAILAALGLAQSELPVIMYDNGMSHLYIKLADEAAVAALDPDLRALARATSAPAQHVSGINCFAGAGRQWKTRMFAPGEGVPEDPATGSAAGPLATHLLRHGLIPSGELIEISQGVELGRPSTLFARVTGTPTQIELVEVGGAAIIVGRGSFDATILTA